MELKHALALLPLQSWSQQLRPKEVLKWMNDQEIIRYVDQNLTAVHISFA